MIVVDASAAVTALLNDGPARKVLASQLLHAPHLIDSELVSVIRRQVLANRVDAADGWKALETWRRIGVVRHPMTALLQRMWELRDNVTAYDASYVAVAESLNCPLVTADRRLSSASGIRCLVTMLPR
jgi:predicted nucleic acid-binding protein